MSILRLAIPSPLRRLFDYLPPEGVDPTFVEGLEAGIRVKVPFGRREVTGILIETTTTSQVDNSALKRATEILDEKSLLDERLLELCHWASAYYHHPPGEVYTAAFSRQLREGKAHRMLGVKGWQLHTRGKGLAPEPLTRAPRQALAIALLRENATLSTDTLVESGVSKSILKTLEQKGLIEQCVIASPKKEVECLPGLTLTEEQDVAVKHIIGSLGSFKSHLLAGVTGSGKTEVYLQCIAQCLKRGEQALVLIPEIGLTPQTLARFEDRFNAQIAVFHSGLTETARYEAWEAARSGQANIVIGTRSAIYTPMARLGIIIVDEEHDGAYKQQDGFRYNARDVAVKRAHLTDCPVVLGSATPSLESTHNATIGRYQLLPLDERAGGAHLPSIHIEDVRKQPLDAGLSCALMQRVEKHLDAKHQVLLFLNRRGYAPTIQCHDCGWVGECSECDARLTVHRRRRMLRCHHCGISHPLVSKCASCGSEKLLAAGLGTEQTEDALQRLFPKTSIYRVDSDSIRGRDDMQALTTQVNKGQPCILLGTQMLTKGHHFPGVSLVAVIDADALLFSADFRGEERLAQLLTQVAGRAGRGDVKGEVIIQSHYPDHPALLAMLSTRYPQQAQMLLEQRQGNSLPPYGQLIMLRTDCKDARLAEQFLYDLRQSTASALPAGTQLIGPLPSPMQRRAGKYRCQLLLRAANRAAAHQGAAILVARADEMPARLGLKWTIDIDPQDMY